MNLHLLRQHAKEIQRLLDWRMVRDFCAQCYGSGRVTCVELEVEGEYNDEGGTNYHVTSIEARDASGEVVAFDFALPFWTCSYFTRDGGSVVRDYRESSFLPAGEEELTEDEINEIGELALKEYYCWQEEDIAEKEQKSYLGWDDLPKADTYTTLKFDLTREPALSFEIAANSLSALL